MAIKFRFGSLSEMGQIRLGRVVTKGGKTYREKLHYFEFRRRKDDGTSAVGSREDPPGIGRHEYRREESLCLRRRKDISLSRATSAFSAEEN